MGATAYGVKGRFGFFFKSSPKDILIDFFFLRERNIDMREKHRSVASYTQPHLGSNLKPRYMP